MAQDPSCESIKRLHSEPSSQFYFRLMQCTAAVSCRVLFCVWGAARRHDRRKPVASKPQGRDARSRTPHCTLHSRCARAEKVPSTSALPLSHSLGSRRPGVSLHSRASPEGSAAEPSRLLSATVTRPPPSVRRRSSRTRLPPSVFSRVLERAPPSSSRLKTVTRQLHWCCGTAPPLRVSGKRDQKLHLRATCTYPGHRDLHERLGHEPGSGETADDARGDT